MPRGLVPMLLLVACAGPVAGPTPRFEPGTDDFFATPWPSDARVTEAGTPDWSTFPNPENLEILDRFLALGSKRTGAALNAPMYLAFEGDVPTWALPDPEVSLDPRSPLQLVDVDPRSPDFGQRIPLTWEVRDRAGTYNPGGLLAVAPLPGWPLARRTTYALLATTAMAARPEGFDAVWEGDGPWGEALRPLSDALPVLDLRPDDIAVATVFTTSDPLEEMEAIARFLDERVSPPAFREQLEGLYTLGTYDVYRTDYTTPVLQQGAKPYATEGGAFAFRDDGLPEIASWDDMRMSVVTPADPTEPPEEGWPVLVYLHGTGGTYRTFCNSDRDLEVATWLAELGAVGLGIDLPLHGPRGPEGTILDLHSFNVVQPDSAMHIHRQGAVDLLYLLHGLTDGGDLTFTPPGGVPIPLDTDRIVVMGHSQGGLTASIAGPWMGDMVDGAVLSGAGGLLAITAVERDADYDFPELIRNLLQFDANEELTELHPILGLVQSLVEPTDPVNYAPYWLRRDAGLTGAAPLPVLLTSGIRDDATPSRTAEALATAAGIPFVGPRYSAAEPMLLAGLDAVDLPAADHVRAWDGSGITAGLSQWESGDHFVLFTEPEARDVVRSFVRSSFEGAPVIDEGAPSDTAETP